MNRVTVAWQQVDGVTLDQSISLLVKELIRHQEINCYIIFEVRMDFQNNSRFVAGGHMTEAPNSITYSIVVSHDIIRIGFLLASLHVVDIAVIDLENAYTNAPRAEKIRFLGGNECGECVLLISSLYTVSNLQVSHGDHPYRRHFSKLG